MIPGAQLYDLCAMRERSVGLIRRKDMDYGLLGLDIDWSIAGVIAKMVMGDRFGWIVTILLGIVGAFVGGWAFGLFGGPGVSGFNLTSIVVATIGAIIVLFVYGLIARRR